MTFELYLDSLDAILATFYEEHDDLFLARAEPQRVLR